MGEGGELERVLDDATGTGSTVRSCCEKRFEKKTLQKTLKLSNCRQSIRKQVLEKSLDFLCLFGYVEAKKFRNSGENSDCAQNDWEKSCLPSNFIHRPKKIAERGMAKFEFSARELHRTCK